jgi:hypothetical protein
MQGPGRGGAVRAVFRAGPRDGEVVPPTVPKTRCLLLAAPLWPTVWLCELSCTKTASEEALECLADVPSLPAKALAPGLLQSAQLQSSETSSGEVPCQESSAALAAPLRIVTPPTFWPASHGGSAPRDIASRGLCLGWEGACAALKPA